jgi:hypothetical protein
MSASGEPQLPPPSASETVVLCPQCQARNDPALPRCSAAIPSSGSTSSCRRSAVWLTC